MRRAAQAAGVAAQLPAMTISHKPGLNVAGVMQYGCRYCGDCWSGCNVGAKNTVGITYIADAVDHGATVFCESRAQSISRTERGWEIVVQDLSRAGAQSRRIEAHIVVLAAGTMGTNELLLRARRARPARSPPGSVRTSRPTATTSSSPTSLTSRSMPSPPAFRPRRHGGRRRSGLTAWR